VFFFSSRRRHTRCLSDWSSDVCSSDLLTRRCLMAFRDYRTPIGLITKGTMVIRDVDVLVELSRRAKTTVSFSIPTIDEEVWARTEPGTPPPRKRLRVLKALVDAGIEAGVGMAPV